MERNGNGKWDKDRNGEICSTGGNWKWKVMGMVNGIEMGIGNRKKKEWEMGIGNGNWEKSGNGQWNKGRNRKWKEVEIW